ncbi:hypothetical protein BC628DRAFT_1344406, partial [Trametes gibbosa]
MFLSTYGSCTTSTRAILNFPLIAGTSTRCNRPTMAQSLSTLPHSWLPGRVIPPTYVCGSAAGLYPMSDSTCG